MTSTSKLNALSAEATPERGDRIVLPDGSVDWEAALRENEHWMRSTIAQRVGEYAAVDEVFQEIALAAARQQAPIRDPSKIGSWLYKLAVVQSALYRRKAGRKRKLLKRYEDEVVARSNGTAQDEPIDWLIDRERDALVRDALQKAPEEDRKILMMKYGEDMSCQEIADALGVTSVAVQSKLHRARGRLKRILSETSINEFDD